MLLLVVFILILFVIFLILIIFIFFFVLILMSPNCVFSLPIHVLFLVLFMVFLFMFVFFLVVFILFLISIVFMFSLFWLCFSLDTPPSPCPFHFINCKKVNKNFVATHITTCILVATLCLTNFWTFNIMPKFTILYLGRWAHKPTWKLEWNWSFASLTMIADKIDMKFALAHFVNLHRFELLA